MPDETKQHADSHLDRLAAPQDRERGSFLSNLRDFFHPPKLPPLEITSQPVPVKDIWGLYGSQKKSFLFSTGFQAAIVVLLFTALSNRTVQEKVKQVATLVMPVEPAPAARPKPAQGGGGGGGRSPLPASKGKLPKPSVRQFVPPSAIINNPAPALAMDPSILAPPEIKQSNFTLSDYGDPLGKIGPPSNGPGSGGGIGSGKGGGVGPGNGGGAGPGSGGGAYLGGAAGIVNPVGIYMPDPEYSDEARKARFQGTVIVQVTVDETGRTTDPKLMQSVGLGLDEQALKTVNQWRFKPGTKGGKPIRVIVNIYLTFRLL